MLPRSLARRAAAFLTLAALAILLAIAAPSRDAAAAPNVLLIIADDLGLQLGSYGDTTLATPNIDRIGREGVRFTNAYVTQSSCSPSRSSIFTGSYPHQNGQIGLQHYGFAMREAYPTIASILKDAGYRTGNIGKVHVGPSAAFRWDYNPNFSAWTDGTRDVRRVAEAARTFLSATGTAGRPFFLSVSFADPHEPLLNQVAGLPARPIQAAAITLNTWTRKPVPPARKATVAAYYNSVQRVDIGVGLLLSLLAERGLANDTLVLFVSDNGGGPVQGGKMDVFENGIRVPFLVRHPARGAAGQVRDELVSTVDILPTVLAAAGVAWPARSRAIATEARSLVPLIEGRTVPWRQYLYAEMNYHTPSVFRPSRTIRNERYKLIRSYPPLNRGVNGLMLFDLRTDRLETRNLAGDAAHRATLETLRSQLTAWQRATGDTY